jgi:zinc/manganese transport system substrate-binding protein
MVEVAKQLGVKAVLVEGYYDPRSAEQVARLSGAKVVVLPGDVGADPAGKGYLDWVGLLVRRIVEAHR